MAKVESSKYEVLTNNNVKSSYFGKLTAKNLSSRLLKSKKIVSFLVHVELILHEWFNATRYIKKSINYRVDKNSNVIDN